MSCPSPSDLSHAVSLLELLDSVEAFKLFICVAETSSSVGMRLFIRILIGVNDVGGVEFGVNGGGVAFGVNGGGVVFVVNVRDVVFGFNIGVLFGVNVGDIIVGVNGGVKIDIKGGIFFRNLFFSEYLTMAFGKHCAGCLEYRSGSNRSGSHS